MGRRAYWNRLKNHVRYCLSVVSIHGFNHVARPGISIFERVFWVAAITISAATAIMQGIEVWDHYQERPTVIILERDKFAMTLEFPTTTICFREMGKNEKLLKKFIETVQPEVYTSYSVAEIKQYLEDLSFKTLIEYNKFEKYANGSCDDILKPENYAEAVLLYAKRIEKSKRSFPMDYPLDEERPFYPIFTELGVCTVVNPDIAIYYTPEFFNNSNQYFNYTPVMYDFQSNPQFALKIETKTPILIYFHAKNEIVTLNDKPCYIQFQHYKYSDVLVSAVRTVEDVIGLRIKQRNCKLPDENDMLKHSPKYSYNLCRMECRIRLSLKYCNCTPYHYRRINGEPICDMSGMYCLSKHKDTLMSLNSEENNESLCPCFHNCDTSVYVEDVTKNDVFPWKTAVQFKFIFPKVMYIRSIIFSSLDVIGQIGGIFSLFLGCSILSLIEIGYFATLRLFWGMQERYSIEIC